MKAFITVGLGFGDEGKGAAVDYLSRVHSPDVVVRYNGGHQAGHNVVLPDGRHHCFHQFGSGTFAGIPTYLGKQMIIEPLALVDEAVKLRHRGVPNPMGLMWINRRSLVTTPWHKLLNQMKEIKRNKDAHGSCGVGVGETRSYWLDYGVDAITAKDLAGEFTTLVDKAELVRQRFLIAAQEYLTQENRIKLESMYSISARKWADQAADVIMAVNLVDAIPYTNKKALVFEGSQGTLLDEYYGFHPHTTWSTTTTRHAFEELDCIFPCDTEVIGITRAYHTRHGNGPLPTYDKELTMGATHNDPNAWQGTFRCGALDMPLLKYAVKANERIDSIFLTCLDHTEKGIADICHSYKWGSVPIPRNGANLPVGDNALPDRKDLLDRTVSLAQGEKLNTYLAAVEPEIERGNVIYAIQKELGLPVNYCAVGPTYKHRYKV